MVSNVVELNPSNRPERLETWIKPRFLRDYQLAIQSHSTIIKINVYFIGSICVLTSPACPPGFGELNNVFSLSSNEMVPFVRIYKIIAKRKDQTIKKPQNLQKRYTMQVKKILASRVGHINHNRVMCFFLQEDKWHWVNPPKPSQNLWWLCIEKRTNGIHRTTSCSLTCGFSLVCKTPLLFNSVRLCNTIKTECHLHVDNFLIK